ncbi:MAG: type II toxin-antitoxin system RelE/ParE family toxin [Planctomycetia bacterium]|nr:type II toxin-antitoxin system RelE/ParE family toxin [Planctomycetia bacterium]
MEVRHDDEELARVEAEEKYTAGLCPARVRAFRRLLNLIRTIGDERELYQRKSLHFEKLKGDREHQRSLRLNDQWRLIVEIEESENKRVLVVKGIEDYH